MRLLSSHSEIENHNAFICVAIDSAPKKTISREDAKTQNLKRYFSGEPCVNGHVSERFVSSNGCLVCQYDRFNRRYHSSERHLSKKRKDNIRKEAIAFGKETYLTGYPCKVGHFSERRTRNGHCIQCDRDRGNRWFRDNRDQAKAYRAENSKRIYSVNREWRQNNRDVVRQLKRVSEIKRRSIKKSSNGSFTRHQVDELFVKQNGRCVACLTSLKRGFHIDHINPLARGGSNHITNIQLLCPFCNLSKHARDPIEWANERGFLL